VAGWWKWAKNREKAFLAARKEGNETLRGTLGRVSWGRFGGRRGGLKVRPINIMGARSGEGTPRGGGEAGSSEKSYIKEGKGGSNLTKQQNEATGGSTQGKRRGAW